MKFLEKTIFKNLGGFQELSTEEKQRYVTLFGHHHFSQWFAGLAVQPLVANALAITTLILGVLNMAMILFVEERKIYMTVFFISFPFMASFSYILHRMTKVCKMEEDKFKEWYQTSKDKIQNLFFADYKVFTIGKRMYVKRIDKAFYKHLQTEECRGECYRCSFKLAYLLKDPKVKILWFAATAFDDTERYGHAVLVKNGYILDTNTRKSYKKEKYLKAMKAEIFYEYSLEEYLQVDSPWELKWEEFGKWCEERKVQRNT